jgi:hypothetical protein
MNENKNDLNDAILNKIHAQDWKGRTLAAAALVVGILCIAAGVFLMAANTAAIFPQIRLLLKQSDAVLHQGMSSGMAPVAQTNTLDERLTLSDGTVVDRQVLVMLMLGKAANVTSLAVTLQAVGTLLTLLLVVFNRRVTLRQINISLAQISAQIKELQNRQGS